MICNSGLYIIQLLLSVHVILLLNNVRVSWGVYPNMTILLFNRLGSDRNKGDVLTELASGHLPVTVPLGATCWLAEPVSLCFPVLSRSARL